MKLWVKISVVCAVVLLIIVVVCGALLLMQSKKSIIELTAEYAKNKQRDLKVSFLSMTGYYLPENPSDTVEYSLVKYCFSRFADHEGVLVRNGETIVSQVSIRPEVLLPLAINDYDQQIFETEWEGRNILIVGSGVALQYPGYCIYVVQDITAVYNSIIQMIWRFASITFAGILLGAALIMLLVRHAMRPLKRLGATTQRIASGDYGQRADVTVNDEVGTLAQDFNSMAQAVEQHIAQLTETAERQRLFIGGLTHEFKTPMTSLLIHSDTLKNAKLTEDESQRSLTHIYQQIAWLERLTQKLLKMVTLQEAIIKQEYPVQKLFDSVHASTLEALAQRKTPLIIECQANTLSMDADLMQSVLINLVDNASKASSAGQAILLRAADNTIEVTDSGRGIPKNEVNRVTEPFYMVDSSRSKKKGGSGLGLALVKQIADAHDAKLILESDIGKGTTVKIILER